LDILVLPTPPFSSQHALSLSLQTTEQQQESADLHGLTIDMNLTVLKSDGARILSRLVVTNPQMQKITHGESVAYPVDTDYEKKLANEFLFATHPPSMKVSSVFYPPEEDVQIVNMKKGLLNHFQFTLPASNEANGEYTAEEEDASGRYRSQYAMRCGEREHIQTLVKEHSLHNYSLMAHDATFTELSSGAQYARMKQRSVIALNRTSGRIASSHIHSVVTLDGDAKSQRKVLLLEHMNKQVRVTQSNTTSTRSNKYTCRSSIARPVHFCLSLTFRSLFATFRFRSRHACFLHGKSPRRKRSSYLFPSLQTSHLLQVERILGQQTPRGRIGCAAHRGGGRCWPRLKRQPRTS
jgi:hypothetical protein